MQPRAGEPEHGVGDHELAGGGSSTGLVLLGWAVAMNSEKVKAEGTMEQYYLLDAYSGSTLVLLNIHPNHPFDVAGMQKEDLKSQGKSVGHLSFTLPCINIHLVFINALSAANLISHCLVSWNRLLYYIFACWWQLANRSTWVILHYFHPFFFDNKN